MPGYGIVSVHDMSINGKGCIFFLKWGPNPPAVPMNSARPTLYNLAPRSFFCNILESAMSDENLLFVLFNQDKQ